MLSRRGWIAAGVVFAAAIGIAAAGTALASTSNSDQAAPPGVTGRINIYSAPFTCGLEPDNGVPLDPSQPGQGMANEMPVKPANYATDVNVHFPGPGEAVVFKKAVLTGWVMPGVAGATGQTTSAPEQVFRGGQFRNLTLPPDGAFQVDCNDIVKVLQPPALPPAATFIKGFVVVESTATLDVQDVITSERVGTTVVHCLMSDGTVVDATGSPAACPAQTTASGATISAIGISASNTGTGLTTEVERITPDVINPQPGNNGSSGG